MSSTFRFLLLGLLALVTPACFHRTLTVRTNPPGARVFIDHDEVGRSPVTVPFWYAGKREFLILHEEDEQKYKPIRVVQDVEDFTYDTFPFDMFVDLSPFEIHDDWEFEFDLEPSDALREIEDDSDSFVEALLGRAAVLRERSRDAQLHGPPPAPPLYPADDAPADDAPAAPAPADAPPESP